MILTYCYRLMPSKRQHRALEAILESQRQLYNAALEERIGAYRKAGLTRGYVDQCKGLTEWRRGDPEAAAVPLCLQRWTLKQLDEAYRGFFRRLKAGAKPGFPRFRGRTRFDSFGFRQFSGIRFDNGRLTFNGMPGGLRVRLHRPLPEGAAIRSCVSRREGKSWKVGFALDVPAAPPRRGARAVGVDLGITTFAALSDGGAIPSLKQRLDYLHKAAARLVRDYDLIAVEKLNVKGLARSALAKDVHDASWARFISMLRYKAEYAGARLVEVDPYDTSQGCSGCGMRVQKGLGDRLHECPQCGLTVDRDLNAARNILHRAGVGPGLLNAAG